MPKSVILHDEVHQGGASAATAAAKVIGSPIHVSEQEC